LIKAITLFLSPKGFCLCAFTHHNTNKVEIDLGFFRLAKEKGLVSTWIYDQVGWPPMFPEDVGFEQIRSTVHCYEMRWA
jgi:predicted nicotinamide N-methyase